MIRPLITWLVIFVVLLFSVGQFGLLGPGELAIVLLLSIALTAAVLRVRKRSAGS